MTIVPLVVGYFAIQWNRASFLGKSPEQIVAMGRDKWTELYSKKFGRTTVQLCDAQQKFGFALQNLNDRAMTRLPKTRQVWLEEVRKSTQEFAAEAHQVGATVGGGAIWQSLNSTILPDVEQVIADCIVNKAVTGNAVNSLESEFYALDKVVLQTKSKESPNDFMKLLEHRTKLEGKHSKLTSLLAKGPPDDKTRVQTFMLEKVQIAHGENT